MTSLPPTANPQSSKRLLQTTCPYCGVGCGVDVVRQGAASPQLSDLQGSREHPANFGRLCIKGTHLLETLGQDSRLLFPMVNGQRADWQHAIQTVADKIRDVLATDGPDAIAIYGSGQLLTEDYYVANKLMKGFIGSANIDTNSRLCMSSAVVAYKRAFGEDIVPCDYDDLENTDLLVLVGSNAAWTHPVLFQRIERAKLHNPAMKVVVVDPRQTDSCSLADLHLPLAPGTDSVLYCGLLNYLSQHDGLDKAYIEQSVSGLDDTMAIAREWDSARVAEVCKLPLATIETFFRWFTQLPRVISFFSMGINQSTTGVDKGNAIINCHLASGKIAKPGCGPFSITGQPNAMGGREVGGLSTMLAAHMDIDNPEHQRIVRDFWQAPNLVTKNGLKAVDSFQAAADGNIKVLWIMATNPVASMPNRELIEAALSRCEMVIVSDTAAQTDTLKFADVVFPATGWSEKNGTVTNSERRISRQRGLVPPSGEAKHDWQIISEVACALGFGKAFNYQHPVEIFREHCALTGTENTGRRALDLSPLKDITEQQYDLMRPQQWPFSDVHRAGASRLFSDGTYYTPDGKARMIAVSPALPAQATSVAYPYALNTGRVRDQWHTMTRTGNTARLLKHMDRPWLSVNSEDARALGVGDGDLLQLNAECAKDTSVILPVKVDDKQRKGDMFAPFHWSATWGSHCKVGALLNGANDPLSGQPELKHGAVSAQKAQMGSYGLVYGGADYVGPIRNAFTYWLACPTEVAHSATVADIKAPQELVAMLYKLLPQDTQWATRQTPDAVSVIATRNDALVLAVMLSATALNVPLDWLDSLLVADTLTSEQLSALLNQQPDDAFLLGKLVCSCFGVRENTIKQAVQNGCNSVEALGKTLKCGTNCGSCKSELASLLSSEASTLTDTESTPYERII
ncbi:nitrate reductase [Aestuariibacter sp. GS-14]|uniref:nitrate reductase n=1 Tax=Aestuariibacter sp. GS-14 TaxID=2590670 RepID=UPI00112A5E7A|nr:nitrate reductase [Aestuariibacter sp. GS-14]TPV55422.1 nitrate reductase [Aestuariibacter sp. GS-14]